MTISFSKIQSLVLWSSFFFSREGVNGFVTQILSCSCYTRRPRLENWFNLDFRFQTNMRRWESETTIAIFFWWWNKIKPINDGSFFQSFDPSRWLIEMKICSWVENKKMEFWVYLQPITLWLKQFFDDFSWKAAKVEERSCFFATSHI